MKDSLPSNNNSTMSSTLLSNTWIVLLAITIWYAPLAFDYFFPYQFGRSLYDANATLSAWDSHFVHLTDPKYALGDGSIKEYFDEAFAKVDSRFSMWIHATTGASTLTLMTLQFVTPLRRNYPRLHRKLGYAAFTTELLSLAGSGHHLLVQGADHFSGKDFTVALWVMWAFAFVALFMSYVHIAIPKYRNVSRHLAWSALNYGAINSAPGLRVFWWGVHWYYDKILNKPDQVTLAEWNATGALLDFVAVGVGVFLFLTLRQPSLPAFDPRPIQSTKGKLCFVATTLFSYLAVVGLGQQMLGFFPHLNFWGNYSVELKLAASVPEATKMAFGGLVGSLLVAPVYTYQTLADAAHSNSYLKALLYTSFAVCTAGLYHYVPAISPGLHNTWPAFWIVLVVLQWFAWTMMEASSSVGARQVWTMIQWANLCMPAFVFVAWPLFPWAWGFNRLEAYNSVIQVCLVPWIGAFLATLYLPTTSRGAKVSSSGTAAAASEAKGMARKTKVNLR